MLLHADAVAGAVGEVFAVARVLNDLAGGKVDLFKGDARLDDGDGCLVGAANRLVNGALLLAGRFVKDGAGHVAPVVVEGRADVHHDAVALLENGAVGAVVRVRAVGAHGDNREAQVIASFLLEEVLDLGGELLLGDALADGVDGHVDAGVVDAGGGAHQFALLLILVHGGLCHRLGAEHRLDVRTVAHQADQEAAGPGLVDAELSRQHRGGQLGHRVVAVGVLHHLQALLRRNGEQLVAEEGDLAVLPNVQRHHPLHRGNPDAGQVVDRFGLGDQKLVQTRLLHIVQNLLQSLLIHDKNFLS